jgi:hypothetical protein
MEATSHIIDILEECAKHVYLRLVVKYSHGKASWDSLRRMFFKRGFGTPTMDCCYPIYYSGGLEASNQLYSVLRSIKRKKSDTKLVLPNNPDLERNVTALTQVLRNLRV